MQVTSRVLRGPSYPIHRPFVSISTECSDIVAEFFADDVVQAESHLYEIVIVPAGSPAYSQGLCEAR